MTKADFLPIMAYIGAAVSKPLDDSASEVYWDLLGDLPAEVLRVAAKRVVLSHPWPSFPSVAELRSAAVETMQGSGRKLTAGEAWGMAMKACGDCDIDIPGSVARSLERLPPFVLRVVQLFGFMAMYNPGGNQEAMRAQFRDIYNGLLQNQQNAALLPMGLQREIAAIGDMALPAPAVKALQLFKMPVNQ